MTPIDRTRESRLRNALVWAVVTTGAVSIAATAFLAVAGLDQAATAVATTGASAVTAGGAWVYARPREEAAPIGSHGSHGGDGPVGPNGGNCA
ncbi:hypothetical protein ACIQWZ_38020 [Streptomyces sp. NPDC098077]|uniref:hypothetical protein n=1 Tax=Streptomyces sp. NPDC098077 TaxID=3366093 RepID=UPI00381538DC